jgi:hypothetical protein
MQTVPEAVRYEKDIVERTVVVTVLFLKEITAVVWMLVAVTVFVTGWAETVDVLV